jgi:hypothetical protein
MVVANFSCAWLFVSVSLVSAFRVSSVFASTAWTMACVFA